jgi:hypothetical protein
MKPNIFVLSLFSITSSFAAFFLGNNLKSVLGCEFISFVRTKETDQRKAALQSLTPAFLRKKWECRELATLKQPAF